MCCLLYTPPPPTPNRPLTMGSTHPDRGHNQHQAYGEWRLIKVVSFYGLGDGSGQGECRGISTGEMYHDRRGLLTHFTTCNYSHLINREIPNLLLIPPQKDCLIRGSGAFHLVRTQFYMLSGLTHPFLACDTQCK